MSAPELLLITPPVHCGVVEVAGRWLPLNMLYVAEAARRGGARPALYDAMSLFTGWDEIRAQLRARQPRFVGSYAITSTIDACLELGRIVKAEVPGATYILGGVHPTFMWREVLEGPGCPVDFIVRGEGEETVEELVRALIEQTDPTAVRGLAWKGAGGRAEASPPRAFLQDLERYPAAFDIVPDWSTYRYFVIPDSRLASVSSSRGCNFTCTFCSQQKFWERSWRQRDPAPVVEEIRRLHDEHGVNVVLLTDEYPTPDAARWEDLLDRLIVLARPVHLLIETRAPDIVRDRAILAKYRRAGIVHVYVGLEATRQDVLDRISKQASVEEGRDAVRLIREYGMLSETSFVLGFPDETEETVRQTLEVARFFDPDMAHFIAITPWPYADIYRELESGIVVRDYSKYNLIEPIVKPAAMSLEDIDLAMIRCYRDFYFNRMSSFQDYPDEFRRHYMRASMKLIMRSSFVTEKMARLGVPEGLAKMMTAAPAAML